MTFHGLSFLNQTGQRRSMLKYFQVFRQSPIRRSDTLCTEVSPEQLDRSKQGDRCCLQTKCSWPKVHRMEAGLQKLFSFALRPSSFGTYYNNHLSTFRIPFRKGKKAPSFRFFSRQDF